MVDYPNLTNFSRDELVTEYNILFDRFRDLCLSNESDKQIIHELKRSLDTATAAQNYLSQELEQYINSDNNENELHDLKADLCETKKKYGNLEEAFNTLQQDYNALVEENTKMSENIKESLKHQEQKPVVVDSQVLDEYLVRTQALENENMDLLQKIEDFEERSVQYTLIIAECEKNNELLRDQIVCLEENFKFKRMDLEEKLQILESTQEQLAEANAKIAMLSTAPDNGLKGNSLFAEVDDQRQVMKQLLAAQAKSYKQMKKAYNESEHEIRRLKRENIAMHTELEACSSIFCKSDKIYKEKLYERIRYLLNQVEDLEYKISWTQSQLSDLANEKGIFYVQSLLNFCKKETGDLKTQLHSTRIQKACLEEQLRNTQQDMVRWRFESLKSRCVIIDREYLLSQNKISFKPIEAVEYNISAKDQEEAKPRIVTKRRSSTLDNIVERKSMTPLKEMPITQEMESLLPDTVKENSNSLFANVNDEKITNTISTLKEEKTSKEVKGENAENSSILSKLDANLNISNEQQFRNNEDKENSNVSTFDDISLLDNFAKLKAKPPSPMRPSQSSLAKPTITTNSTEPALALRSILTKHNDSLFKDSGKSVKFSSNADTVRHLSPDSPTPTTATSKSSEVNLKSDVKLTTSNENSNNSTDKQSRPKSKVIVRRIFVRSKRD